MSTVPVFAPDGTLGDIPQENLAAAVKAGAKPGVHITAPDGSPGVIPADRTQDAVKAGAKVVPLQDQPTKSWLSEAGSALWNDIKSIPSAITAPDPLADPSVSDADKWKIAQQQNANAQKLNEQRAQMSAPRLWGVPTASGLPYSLGASANEMMGVNVAGEEQAAKEGNPGAVVGHAAAVPAMMATGEALSAAPGLLGKAALLGRTPAEAYQSALKPSTTIAPAKVASMVQTGLNEGIPVSKAGAAKLSSLIEDLNDTVTNEIGSGQGKTISKGAVLQRLNPVVSKFSQQVTPAADLNEIANTGKEFADSHPSDIPAADAQAMKQGTYQQLGNKAYGEVKTANIEAQKALARGIKEELENAFPELHDLNQGLSKAYDLQPVLEKAIQRGANHQLMGISTPIVAGATKAITNSNMLSAASAAIKAIVDDPVVKSKLAISLNKAGVPWSAANAKVAAYSAALAQGASDSNNATRDDRASE